MPVGQVQAWVREGVSVALGILPSGRHRKIVEEQVVAEVLGHPEPWVERWVTQVTPLRSGPNNRATPSPLYLPT